MIVLDLGQYLDVTAREEVVLIIVDTLTQDLPQLAHPSLSLSALRKSSQSLKLSELHLARWVTVKEIARVMMIARYACDENVPWVCMDL